MRTYSETNFEDHIEERLNRSGYRSLSNPADYDQYACLIREELLRFIRDSQPEMYQRLEFQHRAPRHRKNSSIGLGRRLSAAGFLMCCAKA